MNLRDYQTKAWETAIYPNKGTDLDFPLLGLCGELGEVAEKVKKIIRDDNSVITDQKREELIKEFGDVYWYIAAIATTCNIKMDEQLACAGRNTNMKSLPWLIFFVKELQKQKGLFVTVIDTLQYEHKLHKKDSDWWKDSISITSVIGVLGVILKYVSLCLDCIDATRDEVLDTNISKLMSRKERGNLTGSGDNR